MICVHAWMPKRVSSMSYGSLSGPALLVHHAANMRAPAPFVHLCDSQPQPLLSCVWPGALSCSSRPSRRLAPPLSLCHALCSCRSHRRRRRHRRRCAPPPPPSPPCKLYDRENNGKGKGKKGESCEPCIDGKLNGKGEDYDGTVAQTASGKTCKWWNGVEDANGYKYAYPSYVLTSAEKK